MTLAEVYQRWSIRRALWTIRLLFAYSLSIFSLLDARLCDFAIRCQGCGRTIPAPVETVPVYWIIAECRSLRRAVPILAD
jgi:hypothetical protein